MPRVKGPRTAFYFPIRPSATADADEDGATLDQLFCRGVCSDALGLFFGLVRAPVRYSRFDSVDVNNPSPNDGRRFVIQDKVGAKPFKFKLKRPQAIQTDPMSDGPGPEPGPEVIEAKTVSIYLPEHVSVFDVIWWVNNDTGTYVRLDGEESSVLEGYQQGAGALRVQRVVTPDERTYTLRTDLFPDAVPIVNVRYTNTNPPSPSPSPSPTP